MVIGLCVSDDLLSVARVGATTAKKVTVPERLRALGNSFMVLGIQIQAHGRAPKGLFDPFVTHANELSGVWVDDLTFLSEIEHSKGINYVKGFTAFAQDVCDTLAKYQTTPTGSDINREIGRAMTQYCCDSDVRFYTTQAIEHLAPLLEKLIAAK